MNPPTHPVVYNLEQAAEMLGVTRRWLLEWLWKHPRDGNGTLFYRKAGRTRLFREADIARIVAAQPAPKASPRLEALLVTAKAPQEDPMHGTESPSGSRQRPEDAPADPRRGRNAPRIPIYPGREKTPVRRRSTVKSPAAGGG
jgi:hypothetical protein